MFEDRGSFGRRGGPEVACRVFETD